MTGERSGIFPGMRIITVRLAGAAAVLAAAAAVAGCPVEGKRKTRVSRDASAADGAPAPACDCPESLADEAERRKVLEEMASGSPTLGGDRKSVV